MGWSSDWGMLSRKKEMWGRGLWGGWEIGHKWTYQPANILRIMETRLVTVKKKKKNIKREKRRMSAILWDWNWGVLVLIHIFSVYTDKYGNKYVGVGG